MDTPTIRETIAAIRAEAEKSSVKSLKAKFFSFYEKNPKLFDAAADPKFPLTYIEPMLAMIDKLNDKETDMESADKDIYGQLRSVYVDPLIVSDSVNIGTEPGPEHASTDLESAAPTDAL